MLEGIIDIHCHILHGVDDGVQSLEEAVCVLEKASEDGIRTMILTPHYRKKMFETSKEQIEAQFRELYPYAKELGVQIYPGCEYHVDSDMIDDIREERHFTLARSKYVLTEYSSVHTFGYIWKHTDQVLRSGYIPVLAHVERYPALTEGIGRIAELSGMGARIQMNADAVLGLSGRKIKKFCHNVLREGLADYIASDCHGMSFRPSHLAECCSYVEKKFGEEEARRIFVKNPKKITRLLEAYRTAK